MNPAEAAPLVRRHFRRTSLQTGAYEFIPLPFIDDWLIGRERRRMVRIILEGRGYRLDARVAGVIASGGRPWIARLMSRLKGVVLKPLRKLLRTVFFWLSARRAARTVVETYLLGRFLHHPDLRPLEPGHVTREDARVWAHAFRRAAHRMDLRAAGDAVARVKRLLRGPGDHKVRAGEVEGTIEAAAPDFVAAFDARVTEELRRP